jgi:hypothetical protein
MRFNFDPLCTRYCDRFNDIKNRIEGAGEIEESALESGTLIDEGNFVCAGALPACAEFINGKCRGSVNRLPNINDADLMDHVVRILAPIAIDTLTGED